MYALTHRSWAGIKRRTSSRQHYCDHQKGLFMLKRNGLAKHPLYGHWHLVSSTDVSSVKDETSNFGEFETDNLFEEFKTPDDKPIRHSN